MSVEFCWKNARVVGLTAGLVLSCGGRSGLDASQQSNSRLPTSSTSPEDAGGRLAPNSDASADAADGNASPNRWIRISTGTWSTCAVRSDGALKCWGYNTWGQLGLGDRQHRGDALNEMGSALPFVDLGRGTSVVDVSVGFNHACALLSDGRIKCWGHNNHGQLGVPGDDRGDDPDEMGDALPAVDLGRGHTALRVFTGEDHTCAILEDQRVKCWGTSGLLGTGDGESRGVKPGDMGDALPYADLGTGRRALALGIGPQRSCAVLDNYQLKCWGERAVCGTGEASSWGLRPGEMGDALPAIDVGEGRTVTEVVDGLMHMCALLDDHSVKCWGHRAALNDGILGRPIVSSSTDGYTDYICEPTEPRTSPPTLLGSFSRVTTISTRAYSTCAVFENRRVKCWGPNRFGELGLGDTQNRGDDAAEMGDALPFVDLGDGRQIRQLSVGTFFACALLDNDRVKCWGWNKFGELGLGDTQNRGDDAAEMGDALPFVDLGP